MSDGLGLLFTIVLNVALFGMINYFTFKHSQGSVKSRILAGIVFLLLTPVIFFSTFF